MWLSGSFEHALQGRRPLRLVLEESRVYALGEKLLKVTLEQRDIDAKGT